MLLPRNKTRVILTTRLTARHQSRNGSSIPAVARLFADVYCERRARRKEREPSAAVIHHSAVAPVTLRRLNACFVKSVSGSHVTPC